jgi:hypothetical protein
MGGDGRATSGGQEQHNTYYLTAMSSATGRSLPSLRSVASRLLESYHECLDSDCWAREMYDAHGIMEKLTFLCKICPPAPAPPQPCQPGCPASKRACMYRRRREAWAGRRHGLREGIIAHSPAPSFQPLKKKALHGHDGYHRTCHPLIVTTPSPLSQMAMPLQPILLPHPIPLPQLDLLLQLYLLLRKCTKLV